MKTVHKHQVPYHRDGLTLSLPAGHRLLKAEYLPYTKTVCCWVEVPTDPRLPKQEVQLRLFSSGDGIPKAYAYVDTAINSLDQDAWHLYQLRLGSEAAVA
ncbi:DUF7352 domain-containing protein [Pseudomonas sp. N040]|uniref:DUF7352 domain-containing protein n=1 Tax=Pseudomonas sp. N040 TaxID=2785325 RepID=UPI0018A33786|nr:hypothetical protein [Pseudomonas sp. N040]MBF7728791.1 hypothetical protein [Pseudomonas sp. N040]MBW7012431.1 hypothetical protein [Pseudomonas sp. N040]